LSIVELLAAVETGAGGAHHNREGLHQQAVPHT
jgi:hypothetical protein